MLKKSQKLLSLFLVSLIIITNYSPNVYALSNVSVGKEELSVNSIHSGNLELEKDESIKKADEDTTIEFMNGIEDKSVFKVNTASSLAVISANQANEQSVFTHEKIEEGIKITGYSGNDLDLVFRMK